MLLLLGSVYVHCDCVCLFYLLHFVVLPLWRINVYYWLCVVWRFEHIGWKSIEFTSTSRCAKCLIHFTSFWTAVVCSVMHCEWHLLIYFWHARLLLLSINWIVLYCIVGLSCSLANNILQQLMKSSIDSFINLPPTTVEVYVFACAPAFAVCVKDYSKTRA